MKMTKCSHNRLPGVYMGGFFALDNKVTVVTGGARGIGSAIANRFARAGSRVAVLDLDNAANDTVPSDALYLQTDVSEEQALAQSLNQVH